MQIAALAWLGSKRKSDPGAAAACRQSPWAQPLTLILYLDPVLTQRRWAFFWFQMKKAAVPTTTARGAAVNSSRITAVQSVYIAAGCKASPLSQLIHQLGHQVLQLSPLLLTIPLFALQAQADVVFQNCQSTADGAISCDTRPTGATWLNDEAAREGLLNQASPGWAEFDPYQGYADMLGGNWT